jgi:hypothetical protein
MRWIQECGLLLLVALTIVACHSVSTKESSAPPTALSASDSNGVAFLFNRRSKSLFDSVGAAESIGTATAGALAETCAHCICDGIPFKACCASGKTPKCKCQPPGYSCD